jgi:hypothetical protein
MIPVMPRMTALIAISTVVAIPTVVSTAVMATLVAITIMAMAAPRVVNEDDARRDAVSRHCRSCRAGETRGHESHGDGGCF